MTTELQIQQPKPIALQNLAEEINRTHQLARHHAQLAVLFAIRTGALCNGAKEELGHGEFLPWLKESCPDIAPRTAQRYMALASKYDTVSFLPDPKNDTEEEPFLALLTGDDFAERIEDPESLDALTERVREVTEEKTLTQLYLDFGIIRKPATQPKPEPVGPRGASLDPKDDTRSPEERIAAARERDIEDISKLVQDLELMIREFAPIRSDDFARALSTRLRELSDETMRLTKGLES